VTGGVLERKKTGGKIVLQFFFWATSWDFRNHFRSQNKTMLYWTSQKMTVEGICDRPGKKGLTGQKFGGRIWPPASLEQPPERKIFVLPFK